jgi:hypothetical protein
MHRSYHALWVVTAPRPVQIARLVATRGLDEAEAALRVDAQPPQEEKAALADVVLVNDSPTKVARAIAIAKATRRIVWQNILLAFAVKGIFIAFGAMGLATMWEAVFADMGTALAAVANSARILKSK